MKLRVARLIAAIPVLGLLLFTTGHAHAAGPAITSFSPTSAYIGTSVTLKGSGFTGSSAVNFNGKAAQSFTAPDDTSLSATVAAGTTSGPISVTNNGATATSSSSLNVISTAPTFTFQVCDENGNGCVGNTNTLVVAYNKKVVIKWQPTNASWCWGYHWATLKQDTDGSGWVQPPDQNTVPGQAIATQSLKFPTGTDGLQSDKSFSLNCGQPGSSAQLQTINVNVGNQAPQITGFSPSFGSAPHNSGGVGNASPGSQVVITGVAFYKSNPNEIKSVGFGSSDANGTGMKRLTNCKSNKPPCYTIDGSTQITATPASGTPASGYICISTRPPGAATNVTFCTNNMGPQAPYNTNKFTFINPGPTFTFTANPKTINAQAPGNVTTLTWTTKNATWCWGSGGKWGGGSWVQPPDQNTPPIGTTSASTTDSPPASVTYTLTCGQPGNSVQSIGVDVSVTGTVVTPPAGAIPFFQVNGGDVFAGGWIDSDSTACDNQDPTYQAPGAWISDDHTLGKKDASAGAIITYGSAPSNGARTNNGVFALGSIAHDNGSQYGFMSPNSNQLSFGNNFTVTSPSWGGLFEGAPQVHCMPDYFSIKQDLPHPWTDTLKHLASGQYLKTGTLETPVVIPGSEIDTSQNITLFVNGNAYIADDITYNTKAETINDIPKFALIVSGNIYISPKVGNLAGFYVAQPNFTDQFGQADDCSTYKSQCHGKIFTCHDETSSVTPGLDWMRKNCKKSLTIDGAVAAADIEFGRTNGDLAGTHDKNQPAEIINFIPEMVLGGSFFHGPSAATSNQSKIDSIISLPPIY